MHLPQVLPKRIEVPPNITEGELSFSGCTFLKTSQRSMLDVEKS